MIELVRTASEEDMDVLVVEEVSKVALDGTDLAGARDRFPYRIGTATSLDAAGTMAFSRNPLGEAVALGTGHQSWQVPVDGLTLLAVNPCPPTVPAHRAVAAGVALE